MIYIHDKQPLMCVYDGTSVTVWSTETENITLLFTVDYHPLVMAISHDAKTLMLSGSDKFLYAFDMKTGKEQWKKVVAKRLGGIKFTRDDQFVVVSDRFGDVYQYKMVADESDKGQLLLGHVSLLTDMLLVDNDKFILTADRDEKVRVTRYPKTYLVERFMLGHSEYVSSILVPSFAPDLVVSAGGDGQLIVWNWKTGELQTQLAFPDNISSEQLNVRKLVELPEHEMIMVVFEDLALSLFLAFDTSNSQFTDSFHTLTLPTEPVDICPDSNGNIWVQYLSASPSVSTYKLNDGELTPSSLNLSAMNELLTSVEGKIQPSILAPGKNQLQKTRLDAEERESKEERHLKKKLK